MNKESRPRQRRHDRTRQAILDTALAILDDEGPAGLSMRALAERSDYSAAGLYEYFSGKEEILAAVCREGHQRLADEMRLADPSLPVPDYLFEIGRGYIRFALLNPDHFLLMFTTPPSGPAADFSPEKPAEADSSYHILLAAIERGIEEGAFPIRPGFGLLEMAYAAWSTVHGLAMLQLTALRGVPMDFGAADREALYNVIRGLQGGG